MNNGAIFQYDTENRLTRVYTSGTYRSDFAYDGLGRLKTRSDYTWTGSSWYPSTPVNYVHDGNLVIQERPGNPTVTYTRGIDLSGSLQGAGGIGGMLARDSGYSSVSGNWSTHYYYHADGNGNITYLESTNQTLGASYRYDPFGNTFASSGTMASANTYRFSSKEINGYYGIYYYGYRFYNPVIQRWLNRDPISERGGINLYEFVRNSPLNLVDKVGLDSCDCKKNPKSCCSNSSPMPSTAPNPYSDNDTYMLIQARPMFQYGGDNSWGDIVRSCLVCMLNNGAGMHDAHMFCYSNATGRTSTGQTMWGYTVAITAAIGTFFDQAFQY